MPPKRRRQRRRRGGRKRNPRTTNGGALVNPGNRMKTFRQHFQLERDLTIQGDDPQTITVALVDVIGAGGIATLPDWFDEFKIQRMELTIVGFHQATVSPGQNGSGVPVISCVQDTNIQAPQSRRELLRMRGCKTMPLDFSRGVLRMGACQRPSFDLSQNPIEFKPGWLMTGSATATAVKWYGFQMSMHVPVQGQDIYPGQASPQYILTVSLGVTVDFRGQQ